MTAAPPSAASRPAALVVAFMWVAYFLNYCDRQAVFAMFPALRAELAMDDAQLGLVGAVFLWVYAVGCPVAGILGDRMSKRALVVGSLVIWSIVTCLTGLVRSGGEMLWARAAMGLSESLFMPTAVALTASVHPPPQRSRAIALLTTGQIAGTIAGSVFGGWMADQGRWRQAFLLLGACGVVYALPYVGFLRGVREDTPAASAPRHRVTGLVAVPSFLVLCVVFPCFVFGLWLIYGWLPAFLHDKFTLDQKSAAFEATVFLQSLTAVGLLGGGVVSDRLYRTTPAARQLVLVASLVACAPCLYFLGSSTTLAGTRVAAAAFGLCSGLFMGNIFPAAFEVVPAGVRASAVGVLNLCGGLVSGCATLFGGLWKESVGIDRLFGWTAAAFLAGAVVLVLATRRLFPADHRRAVTAS